MRIALVSFDFPEYSVRLAGALAQRGEVLLLLNGALADPYLSQLDPRVRYVPIPRARYRQAFQQIARNRWIWRQIHAFRPDVLHLQQGSMWFNMSMEFHRGIPIVLTVHDARRHPGDKLSRKTPHFFSTLGFRRADRIIAHNRHVRTLLCKSLKLAEGTIDVIPHIQLSGAEDPDIPLRDGKTVLFFGRIWPYKGLEYLIAAEPWITQSIPGVKIVIAGEGENLDGYRRKMVHPEQFTILNRRIPEPEAAELFRNAAVVVLPYTEASQSGVLPIAYSYGKPVVASAVGGLPEMVEDGKTGFLVPAEDARWLAQAIVRILGDDELRRRMGRAAREKIERECSPHVIAEQTLQSYHRALSSAATLLSSGLAAPADPADGSNSLPHIPTEVSCLPNKHI